MPVLIQPEGSRDDIDEFHRDVDEHPQIRLVVAESIPGGRGAVVQILADPIGVSGVMAMVKVISLWIRRDRNRSVTLKRSMTDNEQTYTITGENVSLTTIESAIKALLAEKPGPAEQD